MTRYLAKNLKDARTAWKWSQAKMAKAIGVDQASISFWERDKIIPSGAAQTAIAALFGRTLEEIHEPIQFTDRFTSSLPVFRELRALETKKTRESRCEKTTGIG